MTQQDKTDRVAYITLGMMLGAAVGVVAGILTAPKKGEELRSDILAKSKEARNKAQEQLAAKRDMMAEKLSQTLDKSKDMVDKTAERAKRAADKAKTETNRQMYEGTS